MKLLLISVYPPFPAPEANHALHLSEHLAEAGIEVHVLCQKGSTPATHPKIVLHPLMESWSFAELRKVKEAVYRSQPDAVFLVYLGWIYNQSAMVTVLPSIVARLKSDVPFITQFEAIEGANIEQPWPRAAARRILSSVAKGRFHKQFGTLLTRSAAVIALSSPHKDLLTKEYPGVADKVTILPPPPLIRISREEPLSTRKKIRTQFKVDDDEFLFLFWGHIYPGKGLETLLLAFERVRKQIPTARLMIVGGSLSLSKSSTKSSAYYQMVRELPEKLGISDAVIWTGAFEWDSEKGSEYLRAGDACMLPFDWGVTLNNSSLAAAATHGLPIIATKAAGNPDAALVHGQNIYLCRPKDAAILADAMKQLIRDPAFRETLRKGSRLLADKWHSWPSVAGKLKRLLDTAHEQGDPAKRGRLAHAPSIAANPADAIYSPLKPGSSSAQASAERGASDPVVSVIVAAYNVQTYLSQCLDSLVHQTLPGIEIIAIDDASTDETRKILEQYAARYSNVRVVALESNVGLASVRNVGLQYARGTHVMFLDGDDWADVRMCETLYTAARAVDADLVSASATVFYDNDLKTFAPLFDHFTRRRISRFAKRYVFKLIEEPAALLLEPVAWSKIYKRSFLTDNNIKFEDGFNSYEDMCFHVECMIKASRIKVIDDPVVYYRQSRSGQISAMTGRSKFQIFDIFRTIHKTAFESDVPETIWAQIIRLELKHFNWMLKSRVADSERRVFMARIADCLREIPYPAWREVRYWGIHEAAKSISMRRGWSGAYALTEKKSAIPSRLLCLSSLRVLSNGGIFEGEVHPNDRSLLPKVPGETTNPDDMKRLDRIVGRVPNSSVPTTISGLRVDVHRIRGQDILVSHTRNQVNITDEVWRAEHDHFLTQLCVFRSNDIVVDIGARVGISAIHLAKTFPSIEIYAVEPNKRRFEYLKRNIEINNLSNVHPLNLAVAGFDGAATLFSGPPDDEWTTIDSRFALQKKSFTVQDVEVKTIESLFQDLRISACAMLKVSAWGSVNAILESIPPSTNIDYLCGEVDLEDCGLGTLEVASWRHSRHHFWRAWRTMSDGPIWSTVIQLPPGPVDIDAPDVGSKERPTSTPSRQKRVVKKGGLSARSQSTLT